MYYKLWSILFTLTIQYFPNQTDTNSVNRMIFVSRRVALCVVLILYSHEFLVLYVGNCVIAHSLYPNSFGMLKFYHRSNEVDTSSKCWIITHVICIRVRECFKGDRSKSMEKAKIRPLATAKPLNQSSQKLAGTRHAKFCSDWFRGFCSPNTWFCRAFGVTSFCSFFRSSIRLPPTPLNGYLRKIRQMTSFRVRKCLLGSR